MEVGIFQLKTYGTSSTGKCHTVYVFNWKMPTSRLLVPNLDGLGEAGGDVNWGSVVTLGEGIAV
jgi:hypothetical protein